MDPASIRTSIHLTSPLDRLYVDSTSVTLAGNDIVLVRPRERIYSGSRFLFLVGESYRLTVDSTALDINGNRFYPPFSMTFVPEPEFRVKSVVPGDGQSDVSRTGSLTISLNSTVDSSFISRIRIDPPAAGIWYLGYDSSWVGISFSGDATGWLPGTTYTVSVDSGASDVFGNRLPKRFESRFRTETFRITGSWPAPGSGGFEPFNDVRLYFNDRVDTSTIRSAIRIDPPGRVVGAYGMYGNETVWIRVAPPFDPSANYTITVDTTLRSVRGTGLDTAYRLPFSTAPLRVLYTSPYNNAVDVPVNYPMTVSLNAPVSWASIPTAITVDPPVSLAFQQHNDQRQFSFISTTALNGGTPYRVTVNTTLRTPSGVTLASPYVFSFTTRIFGVVESRPANDETGVSISQDLDIRFNSPVDTAEFLKAFTIEPPVDDYSIWWSGDWVYFRPFELLPETEYAWSLDSTLISRAGERLTGLHSAHFTTGPFEIGSSYPADGMVGFIAQKLSFSCSADIKTTTLPGSVTLTDSAGNAVAGGFLLNSSTPRVFIFDPYNPLLPMTTYTATVATTLTSKGGVPLNQPFTITFQTAP